MHDPLRNKSGPSSKLALPSAPAAGAVKPLRRTALPAAETDANPERLIAQAQADPGRALPPELRAQFEASLGSELGDVRIHTSPDSARAAQSVGARAYAVGRDIHFGEGEYRPTSADGQQLLAHEVAHTAQEQGGGRSTPRFRLAVSQPWEPAEVEADRAAEAMIARRPYRLARQPAAIHREGKKKGPESKAVDGMEASGKGDKIEIKLFGFSVSSDPSKFASYQHDLGEHSFPKEPLKITQQSAPIVLGLGLSFYIKAVAQAQASLSGAITLSCFGNEAAKTIGVLVSGMLAVGGKGSASLAAVLAAGAPGVLALNAEGRLVAEIALGGELGVQGGFTFRPKTGGSGSGAIVGSVKGGVTGALDIAVSYDAPWRAGKGSKDLAKYRLAEWEVLTLSGLGMMPFGVDVGKDIQPTVSALKMTFNPPPSPVLSEGLAHDTHQKLYALSQQYDAALRAGDLPKMVHLHQAMKALDGDMLLPPPIELEEGSYFDEEGRLRNANNEVCEMSEVEVEDGFDVDIEPDGRIRIKGPPLPFDEAAEPGPGASEASPPASTQA